MKDLETLKKELNEYRLSRPSDISATQKLKGSDMRSLMKNIKARINKGEKRRKIVKDELVKYWKKKGIAKRDQVLKQLKKESVGEENITEGGNMFPEADRIHKSEIAQTISYLEKISGLPRLSDRLLGSAGKAEYSGDLDFIVKLEELSEIGDLKKRLEDHLGQDFVRKYGKMVSASVPIRGKESRRVQADFIFHDDPKWGKFFNSSPGDESKLKGVHRNVAISALASFLDRKESAETDNQGRPVEKVRWKWSPNDGFVKIRRHSYRNEHTGKWVKRQKDEIIGAPIKDPEEVANLLFRGKAGVEALSSAETVIDAVKKAYPPKKAEAIFQRMAQNFKDIEARPSFADTKFEYPPVIQKYMR